MDGRKPAARAHHNLRHLLSADQQAAALTVVGGPGATPAAAGERILMCRQKELQQLFQQVYSVATNSFNNEWLRRKLLSAVGLPPSWRPPPVLAPELPPICPEECSRYGRRRRRITPFGAPESSSEEEWEEAGEREASPVPPPAIRRRPSNPSLAAVKRESSADSGSAPAHEPSPHAWALPASVTSGDGGSAAATPTAILAMQARAAASFATQPVVPTRVAVALRTVAAPAAPAASAPLSDSQFTSLAALLSDPGCSAPVQPMVPVPGLKAEPTQQLNSRDSLSAQLHNLYSAWEQGTVSLNLL